MLRVLAFQFVETKCGNPGNSVPSPFDSCNICRCTDKGVIEGCTKRLCFTGVSHIYYPSIIGFTSVFPPIFALKLIPRAITRMIVLTSARNWQMEYSILVRKFLKRNAEASTEKKLIIALESVSIQNTATQTKLART